jgi:pilus assembly protein CpaF
MSWDVIIPFLRPIETWLRDPDVSDILVNGGGRVFVEKFGHLQETPAVTISEKSLQTAVRNIARVLGDDIGPEKPLLDARLPDGSRVTAVFPPCSVTGTALAIRKFHGRRYTVDELVNTGSLTPELLMRLQDAIMKRQNILISGGTGTGKTTLLNALAGLIDREERIVVIEDTAEIQLESRNLVRLEARRAQPPAPAITIRDLLRTTLRLRPDRILVGEIRGGEAFDFLQALNTGHSGTLSTIHANSAGQAISRFSTCVLQSDIDLPYKAVRTSIGEALNLLIHIERQRGRRFVRQVLEIKRYDQERDRYDLEGIYESA